MARSFDYDVFMSYSRDQLDRDVTVRVQDELQRFTRPWYRPRARTLRVFRDQINLRASPDLWGSIEDAMSSSRWPLLVASPGRLSHQASAASSSGGASGAAREISASPSPMVSSAGMRPGTTSTGRRRQRFRVRHWGRL